MPSPLAHWTVGLLVCRQLWPATARPSGRLPWRWILLTSLALSLLPDAGSVIGLIVGDFGRFHNSWEHSLMVGLVFALLAAAVAGVLRLRSGWQWLAMVLLCYELHVLMDLFTVGRGVKLLWPFSEARYSPPVKLFYGLHWSDGWLSPRHLWTLVSELGFVGVVAAAAGLWYRRRGRSAAATWQDGATGGS